MRRCALACTAVLWVGMTASAIEPYKLSPGTFRIRTAADVAIRDDQGNKDLHVKIYLPDGDGPFPVVVFSYGFGAGKDAFGPIGSHWASHGFVSIHPQHADGGATNPLQQRNPDSKADKTKAEGEKPRLGDGLNREKLRSRLQAGGTFGGGPSGLTRFGGASGSGSSSVGTATDFVKTSSTAFLDAYLKQEAAAEKFLATGLSQFVGKQATLSRK